MEKNPYTFDEKNPRLVVNCERDAKLMSTMAAVFLGSVYMFNKKRFRIDQNAINLLAFTAGACPASYFIAQQLVGDATVEAGLLNNERETGR